MDEIKRYVIIDGDNGVFEGKAYFDEQKAKVRAFDALKCNEIRSPFSRVTVQEITY